MIKLVFCLRRHPDLTREEFSQYWAGPHGALALRLAGDLRVRRYVQSHTVDTPLNAAFGAPRDSMEPFDGVVELWFDDLDTVIDMVGSPAGRRAGKLLLEDERNFVDLERSSIFFVREDELLSP